MIYSTSSHEIDNIITLTKFVQVGIMLQGMVIDNMVIGGPAFDSGLMRSDPSAN